MKTKIYLTIPYSGMEKESFSTANTVASLLMLQGYNVFSPITHSHILAQKMPSQTHEFWMEIDEQFIQWCDELWIYDFNASHEESRGVQAELTLAHHYSKPTKMIIDISESGVTLADLCPWCTEWNMIDGHCETCGM